jgi:hypothetical protein
VSESQTATFTPGVLKFRQFSKPPASAARARHLRRNCAAVQYHCVHEARNYGHWIYRELWDLGIEWLGARLADMPTREEEPRVKTDRVDAAKSSPHLRNHQVRGVYVPHMSAIED